MRQGHPELNFRRGRGRIRELRQCRAFVESGGLLEWLRPWSLCVAAYQRAMSARTL
jgi:hypothetical protein